MGKILDNIKKEDYYESPLKEVLAEYAHNAWSGWMEYLFSLSEKTKEGSVVIPKEKVERWKKQIYTLYKDLPEPEKESDREQAQKILDILNMVPIKKPIEIMGIGVDPSLGKKLQYNITGHYSNDS